MTSGRTDVDSWADMSLAEKRGDNSKLAPSTDLLISHKELDPCSHFHGFSFYYESRWDEFYILTFILKGFLNFPVGFIFRKFKLIIFEKK